MTKLHGRSLIAECDGCKAQRVVASGLVAETLAAGIEDGNHNKVAELLGRVGWGIEPDGYVECGECAVENGSPVGDSK